MTCTITRRRALSLAAASSVLAMPAIAQTRETPGITSTEILLGQTMPYSGPASSYAPIGHVEVAYMDFINAQGGINGRKIKLLSLDDSYSPPKAVEDIRKLVESDHVAAIFQQLGTPTAVSTRRYLNQRKVPQIFVASGATLFGDHEHFPWTIGWQVSYHTEGYVYARYILEQKSDAKIGMLYQNDDSGKDFSKGFRDGLGAKVSQLVSVQSYEVTDPTVDSQVNALHQAGVDALFVASVPRFTALALRAVTGLGWKPLYVIASVGSSVASGINPVGPEHAIGLVTGAYMKDPSDPQWEGDPGYKDWLAFMRKYRAGSELNDINNVYGYCAAQTLIPVLQQCGEDLSRENIMRQATNLDIQLPMFQNGIRFTTTASDYYGIKKLRLQRFDGKGWVPFGEPIGV
ncbi:MAG: ABC transporter substrate-binding protein [Acetobacteraceae bacterium]